MWYFCCWNRNSVSGTFAFPLLEEVQTHQSLPKFISAQRMGGRETQNPECSWDEVCAVSMIKWLWMMKIVSVYYVFHHKALWKPFLESNRWTRYSYHEHFRFRSSPLIWMLQIFFHTQRDTSFSFNIKYAQQPVLEASWSVLISTQRKSIL